MKHWSPCVVGQWWWSFNNNAPFTICIVGGPEKYTCADRAHRTHNSCSIEHLSRATIEAIKAIEGLKLKSNRDSPTLWPSHSSFHCVSPFAWKFSFNADHFSSLSTRLMMNCILLLYYCLMALKLNVLMLDSF